MRTMERAATQPRREARGGVRLAHEPEARAEGENVRPAGAVPANVFTRPEREAGFRVTNQIRAELGRAPLRSMRDVDLNEYAVKVEAVSKCT